MLETLQKKMIYGRLKKTVTKKAIKFFGVKNLNANIITMEAIHKLDNLIITVDFLEGKKHQEFLILSEHSTFLDAFISNVEKIAPNFNKPLYTKLEINYAENTEKVAVMYEDEKGEKQTFMNTNKF